MLFQMSYEECVIYELMYAFRRYVLCGFALVDTTFVLCGFAKVAETIR